MFSGLLLPYCRRFSHTGSDFPQVSSMGSSTAVCSCVLVQLRFPQVCSMGSSTCAPVLFYSIGSTACALLPQAPSSTLCTLCSCVIHNVFVHCACVRACACAVAISCTWAILGFITFAAGPVQHHWTKIMRGAH